ncbi:hypothetical protein ASPBRDRAFT_42093 [Aspergillus brasiliensis CBS 101740]|uniref:Secreted protein n=1 Tax=Aspergillus brasiliensis (strain CBS 101740 / IMI 381727 / IBT 21946) TaxID=767769 RepID=A0A1L9ULB8_ASPBC|nr:hypothetical protein ASPBRDRAFT_42093 [Aspergillus brasiliensis CBS 101740]
MPLVPNLTVVSLSLSLSSSLPLSLAVPSHGGDSHRLSSESNERRPRPWRRCVALGVNGPPISSWPLPPTNPLVVPRRYHLCGRRYIIHCPSS